MEGIEDAIVEIAAAVWEAILGLPLLESAPSAGGPAEESALVGVVRISGAWEGAVTVACPTPLARQAAAIMFGLASGDVSAPETADALGELTNIIGGNLKALLPKPSRVSLPAVGTASEVRHAVGADAPAVRRVAMECQGASLLVTLLGCPAS
jgi:chemotaxis protein CheX